MPRFRFAGKDAKGASIDGTLDAATESEVAAMLLARQVVPISIRAAGETSAKRPGFLGDRTRIGLKDLQRLSKRLHYLLRAGMDLSRALQLLEKQEKSKPLLAFLSQLRQQVQAGRSLTAALAASGQRIPPHYLGILQAGETSGALDRSFESIAQLIDRRLTLRGKLISALIYPVILFVAAILTMVMLSTTVIPRFQPIFDQAGAKLPAITRVVMGMADLVQAGWLPGFAVVAMLTGGITLAGRKPQGRLALHRFILRIPFVGDLLIKAAYGQLAHAWSIQLASGVTVTQAMRQGLGGVGNVQIRAAVERALERIVSGKSLGTALARDASIPILFKEFVELGEHTGKLPETLGELARIYETEIEQDVQRGMTLITPVATLVLGGMVAMVMAALMAAVMAVNDLAL